MIFSYTVASLLNILLRALAVKFKSVASSFCSTLVKFLQAKTHLGPVVQRVDNAIVSN